MAVYIEGLDFVKESDGSYLQEHFSDHQEIPKRYVFTLSVKKDGQIDATPWEEDWTGTHEGTHLSARVMPEHGDLIDKDELNKLVGETFDTFLARLDLRCPEAVIESVTGVYIEGVAFPRNDEAYRQYRCGRNREREIPRGYVFTFFVEKDGQFDAEPWQCAEMGIPAGTYFRGRVMSGYGALIDKDELSKLVGESFDAFLSKLNLRCPEAVIKANKEEANDKRKRVQHYERR